MDTLGDWIDVAPWKSGRVLLIDPNSFLAEHTVTGKRQMLDDEPDAFTEFIAAWGGEWKTTARKFGPGDAEKVRERLG